MPFAVGRLGTHQKIAYTGTAAPIANGFGAQTTCVRVVCTSDAYIAFGAAPVADANSVFIPANTPEVFVVTPGMKVSGMQVTAGGTLHVTELA